MPRPSSPTCAHPDYCCDCADPPTDRSTVRPLGMFGGFDARIVCTGDRYGVEGRLVHKSPKAMIEYWREGHFVSRYNLATLFCVDRCSRAGDSPISGLCLDGGNTHIAAIVIGAADKLASLNAALEYLSKHVGGA